MSLPPLELDLDAASRRSVTPASLESLLRSGLRSVHQPIVDLRTRQVVAFEALVRGPAGTALATPDALFRRARQEGRVAELDWVCRRLAIESALAAGLPAGIPLFINIEAAALDAPIPPEAIDVLARAMGRLHLVFELTERDQLQRPAALIRAVRWARKRGWSIAIDDVGADPASDILMPVLDPDIIKLDRSAVHGDATGARVAQLSAVLSQAERRRAIVLAEGIETEAQASRALSMGARLGQGWLFGRPGSLPALDAPGWHRADRHRRPQRIEATPSSALFPRRTTERATETEMLGFSQHLEGWALASQEPMIILSTFQHIDRFDPFARAVYASLARRCLLVGVGGTGFPTHPEPGVRGWHVPAVDPLAREWCVVVLGSNLAGALVGRELHPDAPGREREFEYVLTFDRGLVVAAIRSLLARVPPARQHGI